jgi:hypothetical protein
VDEKLRYPKRNGTTTRYLSEPEVAAAYAERAAGAARQANRIKQVEQDAFHRIDRERDAWVVVTLLPDVPGDLPITAASSNEFQEPIIGTEPAIVPLGINLHRARVGRRRFLADGTSGNSPLAQYASLELHADGAGAYGLVLPDFQAMRMFGQDPDQPMNQVVNDEWIVVAVLSGLTRLAQHARDLTAASGNAVVRATLLPATSAESLQIGHGRFGIGESRSQVPRHQELVTAEAVATLDSLASPGPELIKVAAALTDEIGQTFGIAEMGQLSRDGRVRRPYWNLQTVEWAQRYQIEVTNDRLQPQ